VLPDRYRGEPLVVGARVGSAQGTLAITGRIGERPPYRQRRGSKGLSKLWARLKIAGAEVARTLRRVTLEEAEKTILALTLEQRHWSRPST